MARIPTTVISQNAVRVILNTSENGLYNLTRHANINKYAKYSPLVRGGSKWVLPNSTNPLNSALYNEVTYNLVSPPEGRLSHFPNYDDAVILPVALMFPEKLVKGTNNGFMPMLWEELPYNLSLYDITGRDITLGEELYMCTILEHTTNGQYLYTTEANDVDLTNVVWATGSKIRVRYCATTVRHSLTEANKSAVFYGVKFPGVEVERVYTLETGSATPEGISGVTFTNNAMYVNHGNYATFTNTSGGLFFNVSATSELSVSKTVTVALVEDNSSYNRVPLGTIEVMPNAVTSQNYAPNNFYAKDSMMLRQMYLEFTSGSEKLLVMLPQRIEQ